MKLAREELKTFYYKRFNIFIDFVRHSFEESLKVIEK